MTHPNRFHSCGIIARPMMASTSRSIILNWGTEYSALEGRVNR